MIEQFDFGAFRSQTFTLAFSGMSNESMIFVNLPPKRWTQSNRRWSSPRVI